MAKSLPGLWRAEKIQAKAEKAGFEWPNVQAAMDKLTEELEELQTAVADHSNVEEELGDLLFAAVKIARFFQIDAPETQSARILKRNGPARHKMFVEKWIPLENLYFTSYPVEKQCDLVFTT